MSSTQEQASQFRRQLIAYFAENQNMLRGDVTLEPEDHLILFKQNAQANFYDMVIPASYILSGGSSLIDAKLKEDLTSDFNIGGIEKGDLFPAGTPLEDLWIALLTTLAISGLTFSGWKSVVEVGTTVIPNKFTWEESGDVGTVTLSDSDGLSQVATIPEEVDVLWTYTLQTAGSINWSLIATNINYGLSLVTNWIYASYYGTSRYLPIGSPPPDINPNTDGKLVEIVTESITVDLTTTNLDYGWIAVPATNPIYTKWKITDLNAEDISDDGFIRYDGITQVNGIDYHLYTYNYPSEQLEPITLY